MEEPHRVADFMGDDLAWQRDAAAVASAVDELNHACQLADERLAAHVAAGLLPHEIDDDPAVPTLPGGGTVFKDAYRLQLTHVNTTVEDQLLVVSPSAWLGFQGQWKNAGTVQSKTWEMSLETTFAKRAYDDYMQQMSKIGGMYASMAKEAYKPVEKMLQNG